MATGMAVGKMFIRCRWSRHRNHIRKNVILAQQFFPSSSLLSGVKWLESAYLQCLLELHP